MKNWIYWFSGIILFLGIVVSVRWLVDGNVLFHSDIARDFWLMKEVVDNRKLTLIGPRSGGIEGMFHGPAWIYFNLPAYLIGRGNPLVVGWWWFLCHLLTIFSVYWVGKKMAGVKVGLMAGGLYAVAAALDVHSFNNPQGAIILAPWAWYFFWKFVNNLKFKDLVMSIFLMGIAIQFQIAFAGPMLILESLVIGGLIFKKKRWGWLLGYLVLVIPLSTYLLFDLRHDWLQVNSLIKYVKNGAQVGIGWEVIRDRLMGIIGGGGMLLVKNQLVGWGVMIIVLWAAIRMKEVRLFAYLYVGFWIICLGFRGGVPVWYYSPFLPILVLILTLVASKIRFGWWMWLIVCLFNLGYLYKDWQSYEAVNNWTTWRSNQEVALWTFENCGLDKNEFGYFAYTADLYGYSLKYAMDYEQRFYQTKSVLNEKKEITCLLMGPNVAENPEGQMNWKRSDVRLEKEPVLKKQFGNGIVVEKYELDKKEREVASNPNMIRGLEFR